MSKFTVRRVVFGVGTLALLVASVWALRAPVAETRGSVAPVVAVAGGTMLPGGARFGVAVSPAVGYTCPAGWLARSVLVYVNAGDEAVASVSTVACAPVSDPFGGGVAEVLPGMYRASADLYR